MTLLDRYLFSQFSKNFVLVACSLLAIYLLVDFFEKVDNFINAGKSATLAAKFLLLKIPLIIEQLLPICLLLAGVITLGVLNHHREMMALKAGGLSIRRIITPILAATVFFSAISLASGEWLLPATTEVTNRIWFEEIKKTRAQGIKRNGQIFYKGREGIYSFQQPKAGVFDFTDFNYVSWNSDYELLLQITAGRASWQDGAWLFTDGQLKSREKAASYRQELFATKSLPLPDLPEDFFIPEYKDEELSISDHFKTAFSNDYAREKSWRNLNKRLSYILLGIPLVLLGLPVLIIVNHRWRKDLSLAIPISCIMAFMAWGWWSTSQSLLIAYDIEPILASWSIHVFTGVIGLLMLDSQDRHPS